jgi:hypothetical protein
MATFLNILTLGGLWQHGRSKPLTPVLPVLPSLKSSGLLQCLWPWAPRHLAAVLLSESHPCCVQLARPAHEVQCLQISLSEAGNYKEASPQGEVPGK